jgi:catechol 2,3-dioxygenase-like lactoylglutathione lyase family enzyme
MRPRKRRTSMPETNVFGLSKIGQISINVHDLERAVEFYRDKLKMKHLFSFPGLAFFDCDGIRLMLSRPDKPELDHPSSILYFKIENIQEGHKTLSERGVIFEDKPHLVAKMPTYDLWLTGFRNSENNLFCLMSEVPK